MAMIARVKIAPVERWCEIAKRGASRGMEITACLVGMSVDIYTESLGPHPAHGDDSVKTWIVTEESKRRIFEAAGRSVPRKKYRFCEHMLEMD
jgi:hypothetical protein